MGILERLAGQHTYLDANIFIYALEGAVEYSAVLCELFAAIDNDEIKAVTSELTLAEVLVKPFMVKDEKFRSAYEQAIRNTASLTVAAVSREVLIEAARLRAQSRVLRLPDAIHAATARLQKCQVLLTNDERFGSAPDLKVVLLSEFKSADE